MLDIDKNERRSIRKQIKVNRISGEGNKHCIVLRESVKMRERRTSMKSQPERGKNEAGLHRK